MHNLIGKNDEISKMINFDPLKFDIIGKKC